MLSRKHLLACTSLACIALAGAASATGGQRVLSHKLTCQMIVPTNWKTGELIKSAANSPDGSMSAVISTSGDDTTLALAKTVMTSSYKPVKTFEDSPQRLFYEYRQAGGKFPHGLYVGVPGRRNTVCGAQISFKSDSQLQAARQVALSVGPAS